MGPLNVALGALLALGIHQQLQSQPTRSAGDVIEIKGARLTVKTVGSERFGSVKIAGRPVVVEMHFTSRESVLLWFRPGPTPPNSDLTLLVSDQVFAPVAMTDDRPLSTAAREPVLMSDLRLAPTGKSFIGWSFEGAQIVWWLFDIPLQLAQAPKTASLKFDLGNDPQAWLVRLF